MKQLSVTHGRTAASSWVVTAIALGLVILVVPLVRADMASYRIVVHEDNPVSWLSKTEISSIMLKKVSRWAHGEEVEPVDLQANSPTREAFSRDVHGRSVSSIKEYQRQIFSGDGVPPPEVASDAEVIAFVRSHPGAIGYVSAGARLDGVKELKVSY